MIGILGRTKPWGLFSGRKFSLSGGSFAYPMGLLASLFFLWLITCEEFCPCGPWHARPDFMQDLLNPSSRIFNCFLFLL